MTTQTLIHISPSDTPTVKVDRIAAQEGDHPLDAHDILTVRAGRASVKLFGEVGQFDDLVKAEK